MPVTTIQQAIALTTPTGEVLTTPSGDVLTVTTATFVLGTPQSVKPAYIIRIYDHALNVVALFNNYTILALDYDIELNAVSTCAMTILASDTQADQLQRDYLIEIRRHNQIEYVYEHAYLIRDIELFEDSGGEALLTVGGLSLEDLLAGCIVDPTADPLVANGYSTKSGDAETVMQAYVAEQLRVGDGDALSNLAFGPNAHRGYVVGARVRHDNLLELLQRLSKAGRVDFRMVIYAGYFFFVTDQRGRPLTKRLNPDRYLLFSKRRYNLLSPSIVRDYREVQNAAYVLGPGEGENRLVYRRDNTADVIATPFSRREFVVDAGNTEPGSSLEALTKADEELFEKRPKVRMEFQLLQSNNTRYQLDWYLGDYATIEYRGFEEDMRLTKVSLSIRGAQEVITPTIEVYTDVL